MSLESMAARLNYRGGASQQARFQNDKLTSLKRALLYSYQACTAVIQRQGQPLEFRCLINDNKLSGDYDNRTISIPFEDVCLNLPRVDKTSEGLYPINLKCGEVFVWKETGTHWLVYLRHLQEDAYFRAQIRRCDQQVEIDGKPYWVYIRGPVQTKIDWSQKARIHWNDLNYSLVMYITKDEDTLRKLHRFSLIKVHQQDSDIVKTWQVAAVDPYFGDGVIEVMLDEYYENQVEEMKKAEQAAKPPKEPEPLPPAYIEGPAQVLPYDNVNYRVVNKSGGTWYWEEKGNRKKINSTGDRINLEITKGKAGKFKVIYHVSNDDELSLDVIIKSF